MPSAVIALGGNVLSAGDARSDHAHQYAKARAIAGPVIRLVRAGWRVVLVHGNGPQVGNLALQQQEAADLVPSLPLFSLDAMTQGQIGSLIVLALHEMADGPIEVVPVVTHVVVRADDPAFDAPTKPIGPFLSAAEAADLASTRHWTVREDAGRGYRRVVASPEPVDVVELEGIRALAETGAIVIACGGGGIPVVRSNGRLVGVEAVIDKDHAAQLLATRLNVDALVLVTGVPAVQLDFGKPTCRELHELDVDEAEAYLAAAQFPPGSMAPKVLAATRFVRAHDRVAVITSPERMYDTLMGERHGGTRIVPHAMRIPA